MKYDARIKEMFFDRPKVERIIGKKKQKALGKAGGDIRRHARRQLKVVKRPKSKKAKTRARQQKKFSTPSPANSPPKTRSSEPNLRTIFYVWDQARDSMVVGAVEFNGRSTDRTAPDIHEHGGAVVIRRKRGKVRANYPKRKVMGPTLQAVLPKLPESARNFIGP